RERDELNLWGSALGVVCVLPTIYCGLVAADSATAIGMVHDPLGQFALCWSLSGVAAWTAASFASRHRAWRIAVVAATLGAVALAVIAIGLGRY
ncbi:MAG: hypothetical protein ACREHD_18370, partial [Pirellulales bacterium]